jgi:sialate O-acetylesterase
MIPRSYVVPGRSVNAGAAVIAVRVFDERGGGGFGGEEKMMTLSLAVPAAVPTTAAATNPASATAAPDKPVTLRGIWKYRIERPLDPNDLKPFPSDMPYPAYRNPNRPQDLLGGLFNGMIHPLMGFGFAGAAWYQAEFNAERSEQYRTLLPAMIGDWRRAAGREFPFLIVQLPHHNGWMNWAEIREAQAMTAQCLSNVGLVVTADICDADLHPKIKLPIGQRLALQALSVAYGEKIVAGGPVYRSMTVDRRTARLKFEGVGGGLTLNTAQPGAPKPPGLPELRGFTLAGSDGKFYPAKARIEGDTVAVWTDEVMAPVAVRYAFTNPSCDANLGNAEGLPCGSFRTDDWPAQTTGRR